MENALVYTDLADEFELSTGKRVKFYSLEALQKKLGSKVTISHLPLSIRILLESLLRNEDGLVITEQDIETLAAWNPARPVDREIPFKVARVLMQDLTGVPALVDLSAMRDAAVTLKLDPKTIQPEIPIDLVIDHSIQVDAYRRPDAMEINARREIERNRERYEFLKWAQQAFDRLKLVPPDTGIVHQVNLEFLASVVTLKTNPDGVTVAFPDTLVGTDSHTPMVNGLGVLAWGVGGIEAEAALLGQPVTFVTPEVVGVHLKGALRDGITATDAVLTIAQKLREVGVVDKFVEFFGEGVAMLSIAARATISNMTPEYGATASLFPVDSETLRYLKLTGRSDLQIELVKKYLEQQGMFGVPKPGEIDYTQIVEIDLDEIEPSVSGPSLPHDRVGLGDVASHFLSVSPGLKSKEKLSSAAINLDGKGYSVSDGDVVIAAITSCTNTSNPQVMIGAGLLAKKAVERGLSVSPVVKTSMAPGSMVVSEYLRATGLLRYLETLGFGIVGYGCTTCIAQGTPVLLANGTTRCVEQMPAEGGALLFGPSTECRLGISPQAKRMDQGIRSCVSLVLQDGRSLVCTPDHRVLCADGRWVRADELVLGKDRVIVGLEGPLDIPSIDESGYSLHAGNFTFRMNTEHNRERALAFARLVGHVLSDGSIGELPQGRMRVSQFIDCELILNDIELLTSHRPVAKRYNDRKWTIVFPRALTNAITSLRGVQVDRRVEQPPILPAFVTEDSCPVSIVREFLGGLFGAGGHAPVLHRYGVREEDSTIEPPAYSKSTLPAYLEQSKKFMGELIRLLARCGVKIEGAQVHQYATGGGSASNPVAQDGERIEICLALPDGLSFVERVGFRYCVDKALKATAATVYWRLIDGQKLGFWKAEQLALHQNQTSLSFSKARQMVAVSPLSSNSEELLPPVVLSDHTLLEGYDRFSRLPKASNCNFQSLYRENCDFPTPVELFRELGVMEWLGPLRTRAETDPRRGYCADKESSSLPTFSLRVVDRRPAGERLVYDLSVSHLHAFIAGTIAVHNCIGNSGPLPDAVAKAIREKNLTVAAVLSGNRNFEARIHQDVRANFLMSPPLVVGYAIAGSVMKDLTREPLGFDKDGKPVFLKDIWPSQMEISDLMATIGPDMFKKRYAEVYSHNSEWDKLDSPSGLLFAWYPNSTYIQKPPYFEDYLKRHTPSATKQVPDIQGARSLLILGDYVTTDHISPAGAINPKSAAAQYLISKGVKEEDFNTYGSRRGNHNVMIRGTFANPRIKNEMVEGMEGSLTKHYPDGQTMSIFEASMRYQADNVPLVVIAGKGFGTGSSRDWAAKGQKLLGVKAVIAEGFERIHRSNLVEMGVLPLQFPEGTGSHKLGLDGSETLDLTGLNEGLKPGGNVKLVITRTNGEKTYTVLKVRIDSAIEVEYYLSGSILDYVVQKAELKHHLPPAIHSGS